MRKLFLKLKESGLLVFAIMLLCSLFGVVDAGAMCADAPVGGATGQPDGQGNIPPGGDGVGEQGNYTTLEQALRDSPDLCKRAIHNGVIKIFPYLSPAMNTMRSNVKFKKKTPNHEVEVYSAQSFPVTATVSAAYTQSAVDQAVVDFGADNRWIAVNETIYFPTIPGRKEDGVTLDGQCFVAVVMGKDANKRPILRARNGVAVGAVTNTIPSIAINTTAKRGVRTGTETQIRTEPFNMLPTKKRYYIQRNVLEIGESTWFSRNDREVKWGMNEKMEFALFEKMQTLNADFWLGKGGSMLMANPHNSGNEELAYFMEGVWYQAGREWNFNGSLQIFDLIDFMKEIFTGNASSNVKMFFAGSDLVAELQKVQFNNVIYPGDSWTDEKLKIIFSSIIYFGGKKLLFTHDPSLDDLGMSDCGFVMDEKFAMEYNYGYDAITINNKQMAISDTKGEAIVEDNTYILTNNRAHMRVRFN